MGLSLEVCVDTVAGLAAAVEGGADRIELCSALMLGGLTPSWGLMAEAAGAGVPVMAMIRPRAGDFIWSEAEVRIMEADIAAARQAGLAGVVLGASLPDGRLDATLLRRLVAEAQGMDLTLHRCFDLVPDMAKALEEAIALGFRRVLTSGGATMAWLGSEQIAGLVALAAGRIEVMAGSGVHAETASRILSIGVRALHGSCADSHQVSGKVVELGFGPETERRTSAERVRALKQMMEAAGGDQRRV